MQVLDKIWCKIWNSWIISVIVIILIFPIALFGIIWDYFEEKKHPSIIILKSYETEQN